MKRLLIASLALALTSCGLNTAAPTIPPAPSTVADRTRLDEQAGLSLTLAYQAANRLGLVAIQTGLAKGAAAERIKSLDRSAFAWVERARAAYLAGNADSYAKAAAQARTLIGQIITLAR